MNWRQMDGYTTGDYRSSMDSLPQPSFKVEADGASSPQQYTQPGAEKQPATAPQTEYVAQGVDPAAVGMGDTGHTESQPLFATPFAKVFFTLFLLGSAIFLLAGVALAPRFDTDFSPIPAGEGSPSSNRMRRLGMMDLWENGLPQPQQPGIGRGIRVHPETSDKLSLVKQVFQNQSSLASYRSDWELLWSHGWPFGDHKMVSKPSKLGRKQRVNHFPGMPKLTNKNNLPSLARQNRFDFVPASFRSTKEIKSVLELMKKDQEKLWIIKGKAHRGVDFVTGRELSDVEPEHYAKSLKSHNRMIQENVDPFLIDGAKWDIGVYVLVKSVEPLDVYVYDDMLLRFCPKSYPLSALGFDDRDTFVITDSYRPSWEMPSLKPLFRINEEGDFKIHNVRHVLNTYLSQKGYGPRLPQFWSRIREIISKSIAAVTPHISKATAPYPLGSKHFFELVRFDFLVDSSFTPMLLEVNMSPNMKPKTSTQERLLSNILSDTLELVLSSKSPPDTSLPEWSGVVDANSMRYLPIHIGTGNTRSSSTATQTKRSLQDSSVTAEEEDSSAAAEEESTAEEEDSSAAAEEESTAEEEDSSAAAEEESTAEEEDSSAAAEEESTAEEEDSLAAAEAEAEGASPNAYAQIVLRGNVSKFDVDYFLMDVVNAIGVPEGSIQAWGVSAAEEEDSSAAAEEESTAEEEDSSAAAEEESTAEEEDSSAAAEEESTAEEEDSSAAAEEESTAEEEDSSAAAEEESTAEEEDSSAAAEEESTAEEEDSSAAAEEESTAEEEDSSAAAEEESTAEEEDTVSVQVFAVAVAVYDQTTINAEQILNEIDNLTVVNEVDVLSVSSVANDFQMEDNLMSRSLVTMAITSTEMWNRQSFFTHLSYDIGIPVDELSKSFSFAETAYNGGDATAEEEDSSAAAEEESTAEEEDSSAAAEEESTAEEEDSSAAAEEESTAEEEDSSAAAEEESTAEEANGDHYLMQVTIRGSPYLSASAIFAKLSEVSKSDDGAVGPYTITSVTEDKQMSIELEIEEFVAQRNRIASRVVVTMVVVPNVVLPVPYTSTTILPFFRVLWGLSGSIYDATFGVDETSLSAFGESMFTMYISGNENLSADDVFGMVEASVGQTVDGYVINNISKDDILSATQTQQALDEQTFENEQSMLLVDMVLSGSKSSFSPTKFIKILSGVINVPDDLLTYIGEEGEGQWRRRLQDEWVVAVEMHGSETEHADLSFYHLEAAVAAGAVTDALVADGTVGVTAVSTVEKNYVETVAAEAEAESESEGEGAVGEGGTASLCFGAGPDNSDVRWTITCSYNNIDFEDLSVGLHSLFLGGISVSVLVASFIFTRLKMDGITLKTSALQSNDHNFSPSLIAKYRLLQMLVVFLFNIIMISIEYQIYWADFIQETYWFYCPLVVLGEYLVWLVILKVIELGGRAPYVGTKVSIEQQKAEHEVMFKTIHSLLAFSCGLIKYYPDRDSNPGMWESKVVLYSADLFLISWVAVMTETIFSMALCFSLMRKGRIAEWGEERSLVVGSPGMTPSYTRMVITFMFTTVAVCIHPYIPWELLLLLLFMFVADTLFSRVGFKCLQAPDFGRLGVAVALLGGPVVFTHGIVLLNVRSREFDMTTPWTVEVVLWAFGLGLVILYRLTASRTPPHSGKEDMYNVDPTTNKMA